MTRDEVVAFWKSNKLDDLRRGRQTPEDMEKRLPSMMQEIAEGAKQALEEFRRA